MREVGYTSTKLHFANSWVHKPLKYTPLSVYVRDVFRISTWSLSRGLCFQVRNSAFAVLLLAVIKQRCIAAGAPFLDWGWIACIRCKASCTEPRGPAFHSHLRLKIDVCELENVFRSMSANTIQNTKQPNLYTVAYNKRINFFSLWKNSDTASWLLNFKKATV